LSPGNAELQLGILTGNKALSAKPQSRKVQS
jgi:hypothetical protein